MTHTWRNRYLTPFLSGGSALLIESAYTSLLWLFEDRLHDPRFIVVAYMGALIAHPITIVFGAVSVFQGGATLHKGRINNAIAPLQILLGAVSLAFAFYMAAPFFS